MACHKQHFCLQRGFVPADLCGYFHSGLISQKFDYRYLCRVVSSRSFAPPGNLFKEPKKLNQMKNDKDLKYTIGSACIGGGQGIAILLESC